MPVKVRRKMKTEKGKAYKLVDQGGKVVGESESLKEAQASARVRSAANRKAGKYGKAKPGKAKQFGKGKKNK